jgi:uncharacterized protein (DUF2147 family)
MRFILIFSAAALFAALLSAPAYSAEKDSFDPAGLWLTKNGRAAIKVERCDGNPDILCGHVHWLIKDALRFDSKNPDPGKRAVPMCGLPVMWGFHRQDALHWIDGRIYKADDGDTYHATLQMLPDGKMLVRGYIGMPLFGKSQKLTRVSAKEYPRCKPKRGLSEQASGKAK